MSPYSDSTDYWPASFPAWMDSPIHPESCFQPRVIYYSPEPLGSGMKLTKRESHRLLKLMERANRMGGSPHNVMIQFLARKRRISSTICDGSPSSRPKYMKLASTP